MPNEVSLVRWIATKSYQPEYFLSHIISLLNQYDKFFAINLQPILRSRFRNSNFAMTSIFIDSTSALITALLPMLRHKISSIMRLVAKQSQLLSHFVHELMSFDISLRDEWGYDGGCGIDGWKGLTWEVLVKGKWFDRWLEVERNCEYRPSNRQIDLLTLRKSLYLVIILLSTTFRAAKSTTIAWSLPLRNPPTALSESMIFWRPSQVYTLHTFLTDQGCTAC